MENTNNKPNIDYLIPFGDALRSILMSSALSKNDIKNLLKLKGIYVSSTNPEHTIPLLSSCLLSPEEFGYILERHKTKEEKFKTLSKTIELTTNEPLISILPNLADLNKTLNLELESYKILGSPNFYPDNTNDKELERAFLELKIERTDLSQNMLEESKTFPLKLIFERDKNTNKVKIVTKYTANQTNDVAKGVITHVRKNWKSNNKIGKDANFEEIRFNSFDTNEERINFFISLTSECDHDLITFEDIAQIDINIDKTIDKTLPKDIAWMQDKINNLKMKGQNLHEIFFVNGENYKSFFNLNEMVAIYKFELTSATGECRVTFGFSDTVSSRKPNPEFELSINSVKLDKEYANVSKRNIENELSSLLEKFKLEKYNWFKMQTYSKNYTPEQ